MSLNVWIAVLVVVVPALVLLAIAVAVRICLLVIGDQESATAAPVRGASSRLSPLRSGTGHRPGRAGTAH